jgi:N-acetyltransferase
MIVDQELGFASNATKKNDLTTYLCILNNRVVGMVLAEEITAGYRLLPHSNSENASSSLHFGVTRSACPSKAVLGIYQLWVHHKHRNRGIASVLVDVARKNMFFGYSSIPVQLVAFSSPTESGLAFAQQYYARNNQSQQCQSSHNGMTEGYDVLVYDCC